MAMNYKEISRRIAHEYPENQEHPENSVFQKGAKLVSDFVDSLEREGMLPRCLSQINITSATLTPMLNNTDMPKRRGPKERDTRIKTSLGEFIRSRRRQSKLTVTRLAIMAGFGESGRSYISKIEHGIIQKPRPENLHCIYEALDIALKTPEESNIQNSSIK